MKRIRNKLEGLIQAINRYPLTMVFLLAVAVVNGISINKEMKDYSTYIFTFIVGALLSAVVQQLYERFFTNKVSRFLLMGGAILLAGLYYWAIHTASIFSIENGIKTAVIIFALLMTFIWAPTIKNSITFNDSFMSTFKAFFITVLFTAVIAGGISAIIFAIHSLLFEVNYKVTSHALNVVYSLFAPIFFLSFTPFYPGKMDAEKVDEELSERTAYIQRAISCPKNLSVLISYIIIPLTAVYTVILVIYVTLNISGDFWTKNLLEPLLVSYAITVILVYILSSNLENKFAVLFRKVFPKLLVPIVLFQTVASVLKIQEVGITHGRYYVIMFGVFAVIAGLIFSFLPVRKNGYIAAVLIVFSVISITPPIDAFTVSRVNHTNTLEKVLVQNNMLKDGKIIPNDAIPTEDKQRITTLVTYIDSMDYADDIDWLPDKIFYFDHFKNTFGFDPVYEDFGYTSENQFAYLDWERNPVVNIEAYDQMIHVNVNTPQKDIDENIEIPFKQGGKDYTLKKQADGDYNTLTVIDRNGTELIRFNTKEIFGKILKDNPQTYEGKGNMLTAEQATLIHENEQVKMGILVISAEAYPPQHNADIYVFLKVK